MSRRRNVLHDAQSMAGVRTAESLNELDRSGGHIIDAIEADRRLRLGDLANRRTSKDPKHNFTTVDPSHHKDPAPVRVSAPKPRVIRAPHKRRVQKGANRPSKGFRPKGSSQRSRRQVGLASPAERKLAAKGLKTEPQYIVAGHKVERASPAERKLAAKGVDTEPQYIVDRRVIGLASPAERKLAAKGVTTNPHHLVAQQRRARQKIHEMAATGDF